MQRNCHLLNSEFPLWKGFQTEYFLRLPITFQRRTSNPLTFWKNYSDKRLFSNILRNLDPRSSIRSSIVSERHPSFIRRTSSLNHRNDESSFGKKNHVHSVEEFRSTPSNVNFSKDVDSKVEFAGETFVDTGAFIISSKSPDHQGLEGREPIDLISQIPPKEVYGRKAWCDGGGGPLGHPKVFINLDKPGPQICGYCGLRFIRKEEHNH